MKIATFNVNGINGRLNNLLRWLKESDPDVVCLQELKTVDDKFPEAAINDAGYHAVWHGQKSWNGVAVLSKTEIRELRRVLPGDPADSHSRYLEVIINDIILVCIYLPNGNPYPGEKFDYKLQWFRRLTTQAKKLLAHEVPAIIAGDFNVMPTELDTYKPQKYINDALFRVEIRDAYKGLLELGYTDAIRKLYPNAVIYTFWDYFRKAWERNAGLRIDHFLLNKMMVSRLKSGGVDKYVRGWEKASDHAPVWIEVK